MNIELLKHMLGEKIRAAVLAEGGTDEDILAIMGNEAVIRRMAEILLCKDTNAPVAAPAPGPIP